MISVSKDISSKKLRTRTLFRFVFLKKGLLVKKKLAAIKKKVTIEADKIHNSLF